MGKIGNLGKIGGLGKIGNLGGLGNLGKIGGLGGIGGLGKQQRQQGTTYQIINNHGPKFAGRRRPDQASTPPRAEVYQTRARMVTVGIRDDTPEWAQWLPDQTSMVNRPGPKFRRPDHSK